MKKTVLLLVVLSVLVSCVGKKQIEKQLHSGNYDQAITNALKKLERNKDKKRKQVYVNMLQDAYYKVVAEDLQTIAHLEKDGNPEHYKRIFNIYLDMEARQNAIKPVLPLKLGNKYINLEFKDITQDIVNYRFKASDYLMDKGITLLDDVDKYLAREAHAIFSYVEGINPNFEDVRALITEAHEKGTDYVHVSIVNETNQILPQRLEQELLDFDTYGLNDFWTVYHANTNDDKVYDYAMQLKLQRINISPERIFEQQVLRQRQVIDGWEYLLDDNGNVVKDSLGNDVKVDKIITAKARLFKFNQHKATQVIARVVYEDLKTNQVLERFPIDSQFIFENRYATVRGDRRALQQIDRKLIRQRPIRFPSNEQMVFDTGEDIKRQLKQILNSYSFNG
ncbi:hypothetical protein RM697_02810 [Ichthyenterobacterium sp. W332]|uniref:Lipoprotein n=1 Tax=Microcosmobacter mediterraneus TaxID=3075607 RepID=A0ABU2YKL3_9FLAO|nr:hypothetical protein [Ichthyenterobacterium sp. W332]MDT0557563.1 hypothetical protein [Ichthyenterobacterium sp. W332]